MKRKFFIALMSVLTALCLAFGLAACDLGEVELPDDLWTIERVYATAQDLGFEGTLEELIAMFKGADGAPGKDGAQGPQGEKGETGAQGPQGEKGETGAQGPKGEKGDPGKDGQDGKDGKDGVNGNDGVGIESMEVDEAGHLIVTMTDGSKKDLGKITSDGELPQAEGTEGLQYQKRKDEDGREYAAVVGLGTAWETDIVIPATYRGLPVKEIGAYAFAFYKDLYGGFYPNISGDPRVVSLTNISLPESVTLIGDSAFYGCSGLKEITIPQSVTYIDRWAFEDCTGLTGVTFQGDRLTSIEYGAFRGCTALKEISIPNSVTVIKFDAFAYCTNLQTVTLPNKLTEIEDGAFRNCGALSKINIPQTVTAIRDWSFMSCTALKNIELPKGLQTIGEATFCNCTSLREIDIPDSVQQIGISNGDRQLLANDGTPFHWGVFEGCTDLTRVTIGSNVTTMGERTFIFCASLESVTFRGVSQLTEIGLGAFAFCTSLEQIEIPQNVTVIGNGAFQGCSALTEITIPQNVLLISYGAFMGCTALEKAYFAHADGWCVSDVSGAWRSVSDSDNLDDPATAAGYLSADIQLAWAREEYFSGQEG